MNWSNNGVPSAVYVIGHSGGGAVAAAWAQQYSLGDIPTKVFTLDAPLFKCDGSLAKFICDKAQFVAPVTKPAVDYYLTSNVPLLPNLFTIGNTCDTYVSYLWAIPPDYLSRNDKGWPFRLCGYDPVSHGAVFRSCTAISWMLYAAKLDYTTPIAGCGNNLLAYLPGFLQPPNPIA